VNPSNQLVAVLAAIATAPVCSACAEPANRGLCHSEKCEGQVLPQLKESALKKDAHSGRWIEVTAAAEAPTVEDRAGRREALNRSMLARRRRSGTGSPARCRRRLLATHACAALDAPFLRGLLMLYKRRSFQVRELARVLAISETVGT
jgi:hypothetical protein